MPNRSLLIAFWLGIAAGFHAQRGVKRLSAIANFELDRFGLI
jgi:hypothetical protein